MQATNTTDFIDTKIGAIPADWSISPLSRVVIKTGQRNPEQKPDEQFKYIDVSSVSNETNRVAGYTLTLGNEAPSRARKIVRGGDTIFATVRPYLRNIAQVPTEIEDAICSTGFCVIRANPTLAHPDFLFYAVLQDGFVERVVDLQRGSSYPAVSDKDVYAQLITIPPLLEQQRIAAVLNAIQEEIAVQDDIIAEAREFKRSLMQRLFTYGAGAEPAEAKETEIGEFPVSWALQPLGELCDIEYGYQSSIPKTPPPNGTWIISTAEIKNEGYLDISKIRKVEIEETRIERYLVTRNDVLFNWRNSQEHVGKTALVDFEPLEPTIYASFILRIRPKTSATSFNYVHYLLSCLRDRGVFFTLSRRAVNQANFNANHLSELEMPFPTPEEQARIAKLLTETDSKLAVEEDRKTALQDLFKTMLHQLMTGQIRLLSDEGLPL